VLPAGEAQKKYMSSVIRLKSKPKNYKADLTGEYSFETNEEYNSEAEIKREQQLKYEKAFQEGFETARQQLQNEFEAQLIKKAEEFYRILSSFEEKLEDFDSTIPDVISKVSINIAEKILSSQLENKSTIETTIKNSIKKIIGANDILVKINPKDFELLNAGSVHFLDTTDTKIRFEISENIQQGGCFIESEVGNVDARISSQLEELNRIFKNYFSSNE
jgi:flagellar assembly protein FliH